MDPATVISTITGAIGLSKHLLTISNISKDAEAKLAIAELQSQLADAKIAAAELLQQNYDLKKELESVKNYKTSVVHKDSAYYLTDGDGPFCTTCFDSNQKLIRVIPVPHHFQDMMGKWDCKICSARRK